MRDFCAKLSAQEFADPDEEGCAVDRFDGWLRNQSALPVNETNQIYFDYCNNADGLPMAENDFDACIYHWSQEYREYDVLARNGKVTIIFARFNGRIRFDTKFDITKNEWNLIERWFQNEKLNEAPPGIGGMYFTSEDFWYFDTNASMISSSYVSAAIAVAVGAAVILFSSHSFVLTLFAGIAITYVLVSVVAGMVALGWSLGL